MNPTAPRSVRPTIYKVTLISVSIAAGIMGTRAANRDTEGDVTVVAFPLFAILGFLVALGALVVGELVLWLSRRFPRHR